MSLISLQDGLREEGAVVFGHLIEFVLAYNLLLPVRHIDDIGALMVGFGSNDDLRTFGSFGRRKTEDLIQIPLGVSARPSPWLCLTWFYCTANKAPAGYPL
jgi:hypothetical protein